MKHDPRRGRAFSWVRPAGGSGWGLRAVTPIFLKEEAGAAMLFEPVRAGKFLPVVDAALRPVVP